MQNYLPSSYHMYYCALALFSHNLLHLHSLHLHAMCGWVYCVWLCYIIIYIDCYLYEAIFHICMYLATGLN